MTVSTANDMTDALLLENVSKRYSGHLAVDQLSLRVPPASIYGILGPNGAGKSTTLRMVMNIIARDEGRITLLGGDPATDRSLLRRVGYLPEERGLYRKMNVLDVIVFFGAIRGMRESEARREGGEWLERMGLGEWRAARVETLSKGMQQKVQFITTVIHQPDLLILDEPASGLDPVNQEVLRDTILGARDEGRTVIFSTHNMEQAEQLCEHVCIIARGRKVLDGALRQIRHEHLDNRFYIEFESVTAGVLALMRDGGSRFSRTERRGEGWEVALEGDADPRRLMPLLGSLDAPLLRFERVRPSLHDIFVSHVGDAEVAHRQPQVNHV